MKTLLALIVLALLLAGGYWKAQNPDAGIDDLKQQALATVQRVQRGVEVVVEGNTRSTADAGTVDGVQADALAERLAALEATLGRQGASARASNAAAPAGDADGAADLSAADESSDQATLSRLDAIEASLVDVRRDNESSLAGNETTMAAVDALSASVESISTRLDDALAESEGAGLPASAGSSPDSAGLDARLAELDNRIATLAESIESSTASAETAPQSSAQGNQGAVEALREELGERLAALEGRVGTNSAPETSAGTSDEPATADDVSESVQAREAGRSVEYKIYFDLGSTEITAEAADVLDSFVVQEKNRAVSVSIFGLTDRAGAAEYNQFLADKRARNVQSYLIQNGFDFARITAVTGLGEDAAASVLDDDQADAQQRAVVLFAAQP